MGYSGQEKTICTAPAYAGWSAGTGAGWGSDPREIRDRDLFNLDKRLIEGLDAQKAATRMLNMSRIGVILNRSPDDLQNGPEVKALFIQNTNPMAVAPNLNAV